MEVNESEVTSEEVTEETSEKVDFEALAKEFSGEEQPAEPEQPTESEQPEEKVSDESEPQELASPYLAQMAEMEAKHREALAEREQSIAEREQAAKAAIIDEIRRNPLAFFEANEFTPEDAEDLALHAYRHKLGDEAPEELVNRTAKSELDRRFIEQEKKLKAMEERFAAQQNQLQAQTILNNIEEFAKAVPDSMPFLADEPTEEVVNDIATLYGEIVRNGGKPTISECAQMLEAQHAKLAQKYTKRSTATTAPQTKASELEETETIDSDTLNDRTTGKTESKPTSDEDILQSIQAEIAKGGFSSLS